MLLFPNNTPGLLHYPLVIKGYLESLWERRIDPYITLQFEALESVTYVGYIPQEFLEQNLITLNAGIGISTNVNIENDNLTMTVAFGGKPTTLTIPLINIVRIWDRLDNTNELSIGLPPDFDTLPKDGTWRQALGGMNPVGTEVKKVKPTLTSIEGGRKEEPNRSEETMTTKPKKGEVVSIAQHKPKDK